MANSRDLTFPFQFNAASHDPAARNVGAISLGYDSALVRTDKQRSILAAFTVDDPLVNGNDLPLSYLDPLRYKAVLYKPEAAALTLRFINGDPIFRECLYLFNVVIALEWEPSVTSYQQIRLAGQSASNFLYDVTDGQMAIGQVVIGGPELMAGADIQVMASNRIHPRAWVNALNDDAKFKSIRVGRGLWQKNDETLATWDSPEGYRTLIHEWGHYAFALADRYLQRLKLYRSGPSERFWDVEPVSNDTANQCTIAAPSIALSVETLMASTQISDYGPDRATTFAKIQQNYCCVSSTGQPLDGPYAVPLPLPQFLCVSPLPPVSKQCTPPMLVAKEPQDRWISTNGIGVPGDSAAPTFWLYVLKSVDSQTGLPARIIAQGKVSRRELAEQRFRVLGAAEQDRLVAIGQQGNTIVVKQALLGATPTQGSTENVTWATITPEGLGADFFVDVVPQPFELGQPITHEAEVAVYVQGPEQPQSVTIYPSGQRAGVSLTQDGSSNKWKPVPVPYLDGHVLLRWKNGRVFICSYSQGGGPNTSGGGLAKSTTGGSADGNAMVFFRDDAPELPDPLRSDDETLRIVTTTQTVGLQSLADAMPRSYIFSVTSNKRLEPEEAALVLYCDMSTAKRGGDLLIHRWNGNAWQRLTTYAPTEVLYVAIPLTTETAPNLCRPNAPNVERYRVYWCKPDPVA